MKYSMGDCLAEYGFRFYEKLHAPIFLINKFGRIVKMNEAGRKLVIVAHLSLRQTEERLSKHLEELSKLRTTRPIMARTRFRSLHLKTHVLPESDYMLIEVMVRR